LSVASESICNAITPYFSDRCILLLTAFPGSEGQFWSSELKRDDPSRQILLEHAEANAVTLVNSRFLIASLFVGKQSFGAIAFLLNSEREYTDSDRILAADLASRAALALQNCMLLAKEQATRTALIQAEKLATAGRMAAAIAHEVNNRRKPLPTSSTFWSVRRKQLHRFGRSLRAHWVKSRVWPISPAKPWASTES
jgi:C4-dicarboxylate-specific signal transduction histidine kinase